ncbi:MAG: hypothetical protein P8Z81_12630 [Deinococcales bacterium]
MLFDVAGLSVVVVVFVLGLSSCSGVSFNALGNYSGSYDATGSIPVPITMAITATSTADQWNLSITTPSATDLGTCIHDPAGATGNLICTFTSSPDTIVFTGTLTNNTYTGTYTVSSGGGGTFTATR